MSAARTSPNPVSIELPAATADFIPAMNAFLEKLRAALHSGSFVKATLGKPLSGQIRQIALRMVTLRSGPHLCFVHKLDRQETTKNFPVEEGIAQVGSLLGAPFAHAHLFTTEGDFLWRHSHPDSIQAARPTFQTAPDPSHDRSKKRILPPNAPFLHFLGLTTAEGRPLAGKSDKLRQVQHFVEILHHHAGHAGLLEKKGLTLRDMGSGRGTLTFAAHAFFHQLGLEPVTLGVEQRPELVAFTQEAAQKAGFTQLRFTHGQITDLPPEQPLDVLLALHACDTATDDALFHGIRSNATLLLTAPCCHREIRSRMPAVPLFEPILRHGILLERQAEILTDTIRALLLEIHGYRASVFEFISSEHTAKNLLLAAIKRETPADPAPLRAKLLSLCAAFGIRSHHLARLLEEPLCTP
jgi:hypothetical protein